MGKKKNPDGSFQITAFMEALEEISKNGVDAEQVTKILREALDKAYRVTEYPNQDQNQKDLLLETDISLGAKKGRIKMYELKKIVATEDDVEDDFTQISLEEANSREKKKHKVGGFYKEMVDIESKLNDTQFMRRVVTAFRQKLNESYTQLIYEKFYKKVGQIITGEVEKVDDGAVTLNFGMTTSILTRKNMLPNDSFQPGQKNVKVYLERVGSVGGNGARLIINRTSDNFVIRLLESEINEIYDGTVVIKAIARKPGIRSKVVVQSSNPNVQAVGSCIGQGSLRNTQIVSQLSGEKIDIIKYEPNQALMIIEAMKPADIVGIKMPEKEGDDVIVICKSGEKKSSIGKEGINAILASKICNCHITVLDVEEAMSQSLQFVTEESIRRQIESTKQVSTPVVHYENYDENNDDENELVETTSTSHSEDVSSTKTSSSIEKSEQEPVNKVEESPVKVDVLPKANISIEELERRLEDEKNANKKQQANSSNKKKKKENKVEFKQQEIESTSEALPIYDEDELEEYDDFDDEEDKYEYSELDEDYDEYYNK